MTVFSKRWFLHYQRRLVKLFNLPLVGRLLRWRLDLLQEGYLFKILPESYHVCTGKECKAVFFPAPVLSYRFHHAFYYLWLAFHLWDKLVDEPLPRLSFGFNTLTSSPQAGAGGSNVTFDGAAIAYSTNKTFEYLHGLSTANVFSTTDLQVPVGATDWGAVPGADNFETLCRGITTFDTSSLGSAATVTGVSVSLYCESEYFYGTVCGMYVVAASLAAANTVGASDYGHIGTTSYAHTTYGGMLLNAYNTLALNSSGIAAVNQVGVTEIGYMLDWDFTGVYGGSGSTGSEGSGPPTFQGFLFASADDLSTNKPPQLIVTYVPGAAPAVPGTPTPVYPVPNGIVPSLFYYVWSSVVNALYYVLQVSTDPTFPANNTYQFPSSDSSTNVNKLTTAASQAPQAPDNKAIQYQAAGAKYWWRVQAQNAIGNSDWSTPQLFSLLNVSQIKAVYTAFVKSVLAMYDKLFFTGITLNQEVSDYIVAVMDSILWTGGTPLIPWSIAWMAAEQAYFTRLSAALYYISVNNGGSGYKVGDILTVAGGKGAVVTVTGVNSYGAVTSITITNAGLGYSVGDQLYIGGPSGCILYVAQVDGSGRILSLTVVNPGVGMASGSSYLANGGGDGWIIVGSVNGSGAITSATLMNPGSNYTTKTGAATTGGSGSGATFNVTTAGKSSNGQMSVAIGSLLPNTPYQLVVSSGNSVGQSSNVVKALTTEDLQLRSPVQKGHTSAVNGTVTISWENVVAALTYDLIVASGTRSVSATSIFRGGTGYTVGDVLIVQSGNLDLKLTVTSVANGLVKTAGIHTQGTGYYVGQVLTVTGGAGTGCKILITDVDSRGAVLSFIIINNGTGYSTGTNLSTSGGNGSFTLDIVSIANGAITGTSISSAGSGYMPTAISGIVTAANIHAGSAGTGYVVGDILTITGGGGSGCKILVTGVSGGAITAFAILYYGQGYSTGTNLTTSGGTGSGAKVDITTVGNDSTGPGVAVTGGTGSGATVDITGVTTTTSSQVDIANTGAVNAAAVNAGGTGYYVGQILNVTGGGGTGCTIRVTSIGANGAVTGFVVLTPGTGYSTGTGLATTGGNASLTVNITTVQSNAATVSAAVSVADNTTYYWSVRAKNVNYGVGAVAVSTAGTGYQVGDVLVLVGGLNNAVITVTAVNGSGGITGWTVTQPGRGYSTGVFAVSGGTGTSAQFAVLSLATGTGNGGWSPPYQFGTTAVVLASPSSGSTPSGNPVLLSWNPISL